jgi:hypothetical protein
MYADNEFCRKIVKFSFVYERLKIKIKAHFFSEHLALGKHFLRTLSLRKIFRKFAVDLCLCLFF